MRFAGKRGLLVGLLLLGVSSARGESRVFELKHPAPKAGDAFAVEHKTSFLLKTVGGAERGHVETRSSYTVKVMSRKGERFVTRFELGPTTTDSDMTGTAEREIEPGQVLETTLAASEVCLLPAPEAAKVARTEAPGMLGDRSSLSVGESWTCERTLPVARGFAVPIRATYTVASAEKDARGHDLLKLVLRSEGSADVADTGIKVRVRGEGTAVFDPEHADRPLEVRLAYRFATSGGDGADSETRTETTISTRDLSSVAAANSSTQENCR